MALRMMWFGGNDRDSRDVSPIVMVVGVIVILLAPIVALLIQMAISRQREYLADASGSLTTRDPEGLARALEKLVDTGRPMQRQSTSTAHLFFSNPLASGKITNLFSTHPPLEDRIARLRGTVGKF
jgi:heat shock protein HtpX